MLVHYHNLFLFWVINKVRMRLENPSILRVHPRPWKSLKISAIHSWSMKVLELLLTLVTVFHSLKSPSSRHTYVTICGVENGYQCLCIIFRHVHYRKMSNNRIVRLFSFIFFEVNKEEVLDTSKYGPWVFCLK